MSVEFFKKCGNKAFCQKGGTANSSSKPFFASLFLKSSDDNIYKNLLVEINDG